MDKFWRKREREREEERKGEKRQIGIDLILQVFLRKADPKCGLLLWGLRVSM